MLNRSESNTDVITRDEINIALANKTVKGVLSRVFKIFLVAFNKGKIPVWNKLMEDYVNDPSNNIPNDRAKQTSAKGNIKREFLGSQLSWPKFCAAFRFAQFTKLEITFKLTDRDGTSMYIKEEINFEDRSSIEDDYDPIGSHVMNETSFNKVNDEDDGQNAIENAKNINKKINRVPKNSWLKKPVDKVINEIIKDSKVKDVQE